MSTVGAKVILIPGAWMGAWIWEPTVNRLVERGIDAETLTLRGLEAGVPKSEIAAVRLADHVRQLRDVVDGHRVPVVLVSHSYSAMVTAQVADRVGGKVAGLVHFGGFLPVDGRSLLDGWGSTPEERDAERADIVRAGGLWLPPTRPMLDHETDLTPADRDLLAGGFTPHPGHTITDRAELAVPVGTRPTTYVALSTAGPDDAWRHAPAAARDATAWRRRHIASGHWPMLSAPDTTADLIDGEVREHTAALG
ncbi:pimeloyl-ACP methyl ester carboxylesterase [Actinoalloteichus hoggarensis]|uniref:Alpha/beta hydrolase family protein n=1 Tax=Actinoalloteichus hoggarensis TaxID=1470176 RepID=A0A221VYD5_9PSEU|nr:alpha/beta hydrolase [Actinoalloteichus hoggarensis]ASO18468.1 Alpha/beta hydrolase family protein [Actinoalloteichus hoggarensis]MBB5921835.1 pimeloyl-ACP methyl ester carboxylesterase [Actinoalloteichus hoggarensis]